MTLIDTAIRGRKRNPLRTMLWGLPGVGKSSWGAAFPKAVVVQAERGAEQLGVDRLPQPATWSEALAQLDQLATETHPWEVVVLDTVGSLEELAAAAICEKARVESLLEVGGGYGRGVSALDNEIRLLLGRLEKLGSRGISVVLLAHAVAKRFEDPTLGPYDRWQPAVQTWQRLSKWCDDVLYARRAVGVAKGKDSGKARALFGEERTAHAASGAGWEAKTRHALPASFALDAGVYLSHIDAFYGSGAPEIRERIVALLTGTKDRDLAERVTVAVRNAKEDTGLLRRIESALTEKLNEKENE